MSEYSGAFATPGKDGIEQIALRFSEVLTVRGTKPQIRTSFSGAHAEVRLHVFIWRLFISWHCQLPGYAASSLLFGFAFPSLPGARAFTASIILRVSDGNLPIPHRFWHTGLVSGAREVSAVNARQCCRAVNRNRVGNQPGNGQYLRRGISSSQLLVAMPIVWRLVETQWITFQRIARAGEGPCAGSATNVAEFTRSTLFPELLRRVQCLKEWCLPVHVHQRAGSYVTAAQG